MSGEALAFGPGWAPGAPEAGDDGVAVYAALGDAHFAFLADLVVGDLIERTRPRRLTPRAPPRWPRGRP